MSRGRGTTKGGGKKIRATLPDYVSAGKQGLVWGRQRGNSMFPEFPQRKWHFLRGKGDYLAPPPPPPQRPFLPLLPPRLPFVPLASLVSPPGLISTSKLSFIEQFYVKAESGRAWGAAGPEVGVGCLHLPVNTRCPLLSTETVCISFSLYFPYLFYFIFCLYPAPLPPHPLLVLWSDCGIIYWRKGPVLTWAALCLSLGNEMKWGQMPFFNPCFLPPLPFANSFKVHFVTLSWWEMVNFPK